MSGDQETPLLPVASPSEERPAFVVRLLVFLLLVIFNGMTGSFVVLESTVFPHQQYMLVLGYAFFVDLHYFVLLRVNGKDLKSIFRTVLDKRLVIIGMWWSIAYTFIFISAPFLPNLVQVVLIQSGVICVYSVDTMVIGIKVTLLKFLAVMANLGGNLVAIWNNTEASKFNQFTVVFWSAVFMVNAAAGGLGNLYTEALLKVENPTENKIRLVEINFGSNFHSFWITLLGVHLASLATGDLTKVFDFTIFGRLDILYWFGMTTCSVGVTLLSNLVVWKESAIFEAMAASSGYMLQAILFNFDFMGRFQDPITLIKGISLGLVVGSSLVYMTEGDKRDMRKLHESYLGSFMANSNSSAFWKHMSCLLFLYTVIYSVGNSELLQTLA